MLDFVMLERAINKIGGGGGTDRILLVTCMTVMIANHVDTDES